ncbi:MAG: recombinase family protein [Chloroflexota bacterium]
MPGVPAVIYARVSTDDQSFNYSLDSQIDLCQKYAQTNDYDVIGIFCEDYTGTKLDRPELNKVQSLAEGKAIKAVICLEMDRFARGMAIQIILETEFAKQGVRVEYALAYYEDSPEGRIRKHIQSVIADYEREKFLQRSKRGKEARAKSGSINPSSVTLYGYKYTPDPNGHKGSYEVVDFEARIVAQVFDWYVNGKDGMKLGASLIAEELSKLGIPTRRDTQQTNQKKQGFGKWSTSTITRMLRNESYTGVHYWAKTCWNGYSDDRKRTTKPREEWIQIPIPVIIDREIYDKAQLIKAKNQKRSPRNTKYVYLLRGRLRCETCGYLFGCNTRDAAQGWFYYRCPGSVQKHTAMGKGATCHGIVRTQELDDLVWGAIKEALLRPDRILASYYDIQNEQESQQKTVRTRLDGVNKLISEKKQQLRKLLDLYLTDSYDVEWLQPKQKQLQTELEQLQLTADSLTRQLEKEIVGDSQIEEATEVIQKITRSMEHVSPEQKEILIDVLGVEATLLRTEDGYIVTFIGLIPLKTINVTTSISPRRRIHGSRPSTGRNWLTRLA